MVKLRQLRAAIEVSKTGQIAKAAAALNFSQPAISRCIQTLENELGISLFSRARTGSQCTDAGRTFIARACRAADHFRAAERELAELANRGGGQEPGNHLTRHVTDPELRAAIGTGETESLSAAARKHGISQPAINRALRNLEKRLDLMLFHREDRRMIPTAAGKIVIRRAKLAYSEIRLAIEEIGAPAGGVGGRIKIGVLPLARTLLVPLAVSRVLDTYADADISIVDGTYPSFLHDLRHGEIDFVVGTIRVPAPSGEISSELLFMDDLVIVARAGHPIHARSGIGLPDLIEEKWVFPSKGVPLRNNFETILAAMGSALPRRVIETDSLAVVRSLLLEEDRLAVVSRYQIYHEEIFGMLKIVALTLDSATRPVGFITRADYRPSPLGREFLARLRDVAAEITKRTSRRDQSAA